MLSDQEKEFHSKALLCLIWLPLVRELKPENLDGPDVLPALIKARNGLKADLMLGALGCGSLQGDCRALLEEVEETIAAVQQRKGIPEFIRAM